jgi:hypothetical protein
MMPLMLSYRIERSDVVPPRDETYNDMTVGEKATFFFSSGSIYDTPILCQSRPCKLNMEPRREFGDVNMSE